MTQPLQPSHHPREDLLIEHATGRGHPAVELLVSTHAALCSSCRSATGELDAIGALLFEDAACRAAPSASLRERTLAAGRASASTLPAARVPDAPGRAPDLDRMVEFVLQLREKPEAGDWHRLVPGVHEVRLPLDWNGIPVTVARLRSGLHIPRHTHGGRELTLILSGGLADAKAAYRAGDIADYDSDDSHEQLVDTDEDCLCLVVKERRLVPQTMLGRALAWITGV